MKIIRIQVLATLFLMFAPLTQAMELFFIVALSRQGASQLALQLLHAHQPDYLSQPDGWYEWEGRRLQILESRSDWSTIVERYDHYAELAPG
ncbi:MAG: hypothetical protein HUJ30_00300, partial [Gammaproteobacteria bacterium]|nr:hypothetical protein [Gammaproteobacteria bacterium]